MFRLLVGIVAVVCLMVPLVGCGGDEGNRSEQSADPQASARAPEGESRPAIPDKQEKPLVVAGAKIAPYFDEAGTVAEKSVAPGEKFVLYVFAEFDESFRIAAAEFRLELPDGIFLGQATKFSERVLTLGSPDTDFQMAFECVEKGNFYLIKYECMAESDFKGGEIIVTPGVNSQGDAFLGFVDCPPESEFLPSNGGSATLTLK